jgi:hypothetical protein
VGRGREGVEGFGEGGKEKEEGARAGLEKREIKRREGRNIWKAKE